MSDSTDLLWIDLETTGLDPKIDIPLEIGLMVTDLDGNPHASFQSLIWENTPMWRTALARGKKHLIVGPMHEKSGLWDQIDAIKDSHWSRAKVEGRMCEWLHDVGATNLPLTGASIGSLDRPFVQTFFPAFNGLTHYRNIDVSTVKELCKRHNPLLFAQGPGAAPSDQSSHRVMDDIEWSIGEYQFYLEEFLLCDD